MKIALYPLIAFLYVTSRLYNELSTYPEGATVLSGMVACFLIGSLYVGLPLGIMTRRRKWQISVRKAGAFCLAPVAFVFLGLPTAVDDVTYDFELHIRPFGDTHFRADEWQSTVQYPKTFH